MILLSSCGRLCPILWSQVLSREWRCSWSSADSQAMLQLHLSDRQFNWVLRCVLYLTHWGRVTHICVGKLSIIGSDNGLSPGRHQAIIWTNAGRLLIEPLGTNFSEILIEILTFSFKKMHLKVSSAKWRPFCLSLNVLRDLTVGRCESVASALENDGCQTLEVSRV